MNADLLLRSPEALPLLLALLQPEPLGVEDLGLRHATLELLNLLAGAAPDRLQVSGKVFSLFLLQGFAHA